MNHIELGEIVEQRMSDPKVLGRIACNLRDGHDIVQRHHDDSKFEVSWQDAGDYWRCVVTEATTTRRLVQVDLHENGTTRIETDAPCRVTVSPEDNILSVTRYRNQ
jgi:hypothetical protein